MKSTFAAIFGLAAFATALPQYSYSSPAYPSEGYPAPTGGYPAPTGGFPAPTGGYPAPTGGCPAPTGGYPVPTGGAPAPPAGGATCPVDGALVCNGPNYFGLCNWGHVIWQPVALGTACENGEIVGVGIYASDYQPPAPHYPAAPTQTWDSPYATYAA